jgi:YgiT-type zinc finger domain-containing protein
MNDSTTKLELPGKEGTVSVENVPCSVCSQCGAQVVDSISFAVAKKGAAKSKMETLDFEKMSGIGIMAGKIS